MKKTLPILLAVVVTAGCSPSEPELSKTDEVKMENWLKKGIPAGKGGTSPAPAAPLPKNDPKSGTPTD